MYTIDINGTTLPYIEGINAEEAVNRFGGNIKIYVKAIKRFADKTDTFPPFDEAIALENAKDTLLLLHSLKGIGANLSIESIYKEATQCESAFKANNLDKDLYYRFAETVNFYKNKIKELF